MKMIIALAGLMLLISTPLQATTFSLTCNFAQTVTVFLDKGKKVAVDLVEDEQKEIKFTDLDSESPRIHIGIFNQILTVLGTDPVIGVLWLAEKRGIGHMNFWTVFLRQQVVIQSEPHYSGDVPISKTSMAQCQ